MPKISVVIPLYNKENFIKETLESVLLQTFTDFEVIVVNDGTTDSSIKVISQFSDNRIKLLHQENKGVAAARNLGIKNTTSKLVAFLDADDYWYPNHLEELLKLYDDFPNSGIYCNRYTTKTSSNHFQESLFNGIELKFRGIVPNYFYSNRPSRITWTSALMIPKSILEEFGNFNENVSNGQDVELWTKIGIHYPIVLSNKTTAIYNFNTPNSLTKKNINQMKLMDFSQFEKAEQNNKYLKDFLDLHRFFYAIQYKSMGDKKNAFFYYNKINPKNLTLTNKILFGLPSFVLQLLYKFKRYLKKIGIEFSTYN